MKIYGNLILEVGGHTKNRRALVDRKVEVYETKTKVKIYLFNSSTMGWHKKNNVISLIEVVKNKPIEDIITEQVSKIAKENEIDFVL